MISELLGGIDARQPVLIAGPTASGKSALALAIAEAQGGMIVNADASQVFECWQVLTARPDAQDLARAEHRLFGHLPFDAKYSAGHWIREVKPLLEEAVRPIIVGGTGLYLTALTQGLAEIPQTPAEVRAAADEMPLEALCRELDPETRAGLDEANRARVQRAWEVQTATGKPLRHWQAQKTEGLLDPGSAALFVLDAPKAWLTPRITQRFAAMIAQGGLEEAEAMATRYDPSLPSCRAIGVREAMGVLNGTMSRAEAIESASIATRQYAKRQRTWFRARMQDWTWIAAQTL